MTYPRERNNTHTSSEGQSGCCSSSCPGGSHCNCGKQGIDYGSQCEIEPVRDECDFQGIGKIFYVAADPSSMHQNVAGAEDVQSGEHFSLARSCQEEEKNPKLRNNDDYVPSNQSWLRPGPRLQIYEENETVSVVRRDNTAASNDRNMTTSIATSHSQVIYFDGYLPKNTATTNEGIMPAEESSMRKQTLEKLVEQNKQQDLAEYNKAVAAMQLNNEAQGNKENHSWEQTQFAPRASPQERLPLQSFEEKQEAEFFVADKYYGNFPRCMCATQIPMRKVTEDNKQPMLGERVCEELKANMYVCYKKKSTQRAEDDKGHRKPRQRCQDSPIKPADQGKRIHKCYCVSERTSRRHKDDHNHGGHHKCRCHEKNKESKLEEKHSPCCKCHHQKQKETEKEVEKKVEKHVEIEAEKEVEKEVEKEAEKEADKEVEKEAEKEVATETPSDRRQSIPQEEEEAIHKVESRDNMTKSPNATDEGEKESHEDDAKTPLAQKQDNSSQPDQKFEKEDGTHIHKEKRDDNLAKPKIEEKYSPCCKCHCQKQNKIEKEVHKKTPKDKAKGNARAHGERVYKCYCVSGQSKRRDEYDCKRVKSLRLQYQHNSSKPYQRFVEEDSHPQYRSNAQSPIYRVGSDINFSKFCFEEKHSPMCKCYDHKEDNVEKQLYKENELVNQNLLPHTYFVPHVGATDVQFHSNRYVKQHEDVHANPRHYEKDDCYVEVPSCSAASPYYSRGMQACSPKETEISSRIGPTAIPMGRNQTKKYILIKNINTPAKYECARVPSETIVAIHGPPCRNEDNEMFLQGFTKRRPGENSEEHIPQYHCRRRKQHDCDNEICKRR